MLSFGKKNVFLVASFYGSGMRIVLAVPAAQLGSPQDHTQQDLLPRCRPGCLHAQPLQEAILEPSEIVLEPSKHFAPCFIFLLAHFPRR